MSGARALPIALVGMPGSGKSTVGRHLARQLGCRFIDSDTEIEHQIGGPIKVYFEQQGEAAFRDLEQQVIARLVQPAAPEQGPGQTTAQAPGPAPAPGLVLATGGGAVLRPANREALARHCVVIYLKSTPEDLYRRLRHDTHRPLLQVADPLRRLRDLYRERDPLYRDAARFVIETGRPSVPTLVNMILMQLELAGVVDPNRPPHPAPPAAPRSAGQ